MKSGLVGCERCYDAFYETINPWLSKNQSANRHYGKRAFSVLSQADLMRYIKLSQALDEAVYAEDYQRLKKIKAEMDRIRNDR